MSGDRAKIDLDRSGLKPGDRLGPYRLIRPIGSGGMGFVYEAVHDELEKRCAIKVLNDDYGGQAKVVRRFLNEARAVARIRHENIIDVYDFGKSPDRRYYFVMELLEGVTLSEELKLVGAMPLSRACSIAGQVARALAASHAAGIVHRDLKPQNLMLIRRAQVEDFVKVLDFGVAKVLAKSDVDQTESGLVIGTTRYMAPEQCRGGKEVDHRCDVYALGLIFYHMVAGRVPFDADNPGDLMVQHLTKAPPPLSSFAKDLPAELEALVTCALQKDPADRFQNMHELADLLVPFGGPPRGPDPVVRDPSNSDQFDFDIDDTPAITPSVKPYFAPPDAPPPRRVARKRGVIGLILGALVLATVAFGAAFVMRQQRTSAPPVEPVMAQPGPAAPRPVESPEVVFSISSEPTGAQVFLGDEPRGVTPIDLKVKRGDARMPLRIAKDGYEPLAQMIVPDNDQMLTMMLRPLEKSTEEKKKPLRRTR